MIIKEYPEYKSRCKWWMQITPFGLVRKIHKSMIQSARNPQPITSKSIVHSKINKTDSIIKCGDLETRVRIYQSEEPQDKVLIYAHGGGYFGGHLTDVECFLEAVCEQCECTVYSLDYEYAPEYKYPYQCNQLLSVYQYIKDNGPELGMNPLRISFGGDSAGGSIAITAAIMAKEKGNEIEQLVLFYPVLDLFNVSYASFKKNTMDYKGMQWVVRCIRDYYLEDKEQYNDSYISILKKEIVEQLPPVFLAMSQIDGLLDAQLKLDKMLCELGKEHLSILLKQTPHGFLSTLGCSPQGKDCIVLLKEFMKQSECTVGNCES